MENRKFSGIFTPRASFYIWIIAILAAVIAILDLRLALPGFLLIIFLVFHYLRSNYRRQREIASYIENLTFNIDTATKDTLLNFPMPLVVTGLDGTIIWYNSLFRNIFDGEVLLEKTIGSFVGDLHPAGLIKPGARISRQIAIGCSHYHVLGNIVKTDRKTEEESFILLLYFIDNTELAVLKQKYEEERIAVGIIVIDNYDELMQSMEDAGRPQMLAEIDRRIVKWLEFAGGIVRKFERDRYIIVFEAKHLKELEEKKFEILDSVKEINLGNKIPVTLSLGFGIKGKTPAENFKFAGAAIDLALGRGGDQAVVKNGDSFSFFGGRTRELEKRTRVKARVVSYALRELIDQCDAVMAMGHENADLDSLGACLGVYRMARSMEKQANIVLDGRPNIMVESLISRIKKDMEYDGLFLSRKEALDRITDKTLLVVADTHRKDFAEVPELLDHTSQVVVIDHHRKGTDFIQNTVLTYQETYASSTCELVTEILQYADDRLKLKPLEAEALYAGIIVDTKNFAFKTGVRTFEAASYLKRQGVDTLSVRQLFQNDLSTYALVSDVVKEAEIIKGDIAISACPPNIRNGQLIAAKAADELLNLSGVKAAFVMCRVDNTVLISGRSLGDVNVQVVLEKLGGGGHLTVAGAQIEENSIESAKEKLKCAIIEYMNENEREQ